MTSRIISKLKLATKETKDKKLIRYWSRMHTCSDKLQLGIICEIKRIPNVVTACLINVSKTPVLTASAANKENEKHKEDDDDVIDGPSTKKESNDKILYTSRGARPEVREMSHEEVGPWAWFPFHSLNNCLNSSLN